MNETKGLTVGQTVKIVQGTFAGMEGTIEAYHEDAQAFDIRCGEDDTEPTGDFQFQAIRVSVPCAYVRFQETRTKA